MLYSPLAIFSIALAASEASAGPRSPPRIDTYNHIPRFAVFHPESWPHNSFRMNTQHPTKDADPERPAGAEGFLPYFGPTLTTVESILTGIRLGNSFKSNTYKKQGEG